MPPPIIAPGRPGPDNPPVDSITHPLATGFTACSICGALIAGSYEALHNQWHHSQDKNP